MYTPDRVFVSRLKSVDRKLGCKYYPEHGHFCVTYKRATGEAVPILMVEGDYGEFRQPDERDFNFLMSGDLERESPKERFQKASKYMADVREKNKRNARSNIRDMTKDDKIQLRTCMERLAGVGKANSTFRRITPKPKGQVF